MINHEVKGLFKINNSRIMSQYLLWYDVSQIEKYE